MKLLLVLLLGLEMVLAAPQGNKLENRWVNNYDELLYFQCPSLQSISLITSIHDNHREDRVWDFSCKHTFNQLRSCSWTDYVNDFDGAFTFTCSFGSVLSGIESFHDSHREDRRWKFLCCQGDVPVDRSCSWSGYVNQFDDYLRWDAPPDHYLVGASSYHDNHREDRRWMYYSCSKN